MAGTLTLTDTAWFADDDLRLVRPGHTVELPSGYLFGVEADGEPVGVAFVGSGVAHTELDPDEARMLGNHLVLAGAASLDRMRRVVDRGVYVEEVDTVLVLGLDATALTQGLRPVAVDGGVEGYYDDDGTFQVVVVDQRLGASRRQATERLHDRQDVLAELGLDPHDAVRMDRLEDRDRWVVDARGATSLHHLVPDAVRSPRSRWTTWIEDPTGAVDDGHDAVWLAHGLVAEDHGDRAAIRRLGGSDGAAVGAHLERIVGNVVVEPHASGRHADLAVESLVTYASQDEARLVHLRVPCHELEMRYEQLHVAPSCGLDRVTVDGQELTYVGRGFGRIEGLYQGGVYLLPTPLSAGVSATLRVRHHDRLAFGPIVFGAEETVRRTRRHVSLAPKVGGLPDLLELGPTTEAADVLPYGMRTSEPVQVDLRVGSTRGRYQVAVSGHVGRDVVKGPVTWAVVEQRGRPHVVVGDFDGEESFGGQKGMPAVRILARDATLEADLQVLARATVNFFQTALPRFPYGELEIVQGPSALAWELGGEPLPRPQVRVAPGQLHIHGVYGAGDARRILKSRWPHNIELEVAEGVAAQWWRPVDRPYLSEDAWIGRAMPRLYGELFLDHAYSDKVVRMWRELPRDAEGDDALHEREATRMAGLFHGLVRSRVGEEGLLRGLHAFLRRDGRTTAELQQALQQVTGADLSDVFDVWLPSDHAPALTASWHLDGEAVAIELVTDLPFGTIQVPVAVASGGTSKTHWVSVQDGRGRASLPVRGRLKQIAIDPEGLVPFREVRLDESVGGPSFASAAP